MCIFSYIHFHCIHTTALYIYNYNSMILPLINKQITRVIRFRHFSLSLSIHTNENSVIACMWLCVVRNGNHIIILWSLPSYPMYIYTIYKQFHCYNLLYHFGYNVQLQCDKEIEMPCYFTFANNCDFKCIHYEPNSTAIHTSKHTWVPYMCVCMKRDNSAAVVVEVVAKLWTGIKSHLVRGIRTW